MTATLKPSPGAREAKLLGIGRNTLARKLSGED